MTTEGSFPLGGAVCVTAVTHGVSPLLAAILGVSGRNGSWTCYRLTLYKGKIPVILAGILVMSGLNSVILFVMRTQPFIVESSVLQDVFHALHLPNYFDTVLLGLLSLAY